MKYFAFQFLPKSAFEFVPIQKLESALGGYGF